MELAEHGAMTHFTDSRPRSVRRSSTVILGRIRSHVQIVRGIGVCPYTRLKGWACSTSFTSAGVGFVNSVDGDSAVGIISAVPAILKARLTSRMERISEATERCEAMQMMTS